jgi:squalene-associated FAD-dependent desaturase
MAGTVHVVGAGLAGLAAALRLATAGASVIVHEAAGQAGGRCRSYVDATLGTRIDNGNHLILSGNRATLSYVEAIGAKAMLVGPEHAQFDFADLATGERWRLSLDDGPLPFWIFDAKRRVPQTRPLDYFALGRLLVAGREARIGDVLRLEGPLYRRLLEPLLVAALNTSPSEGSAALAGAIIRETMLAGGRACRPLVARHGLSSALIDPCLARLAGLGATVGFGRRLRGLGFTGDSVTSLDFGDDQIALGPHDALILAVPAPVAPALVPGLVAPTTFRAIVNGHFAIEPPKDMPPLLGVVAGTVEWLFAFEGRLSTTTSNADRLCDLPREELAELLWRDVAKLTGIAAMPRWQIVRERRATFAATPDENRKRPAAATRWRNLHLAGDWTATGLPATIEGAIRSGNRAADLVLHGRTRVLAGA